jgi:hypothetical protein
MVRYRNVIHTLRSPTRPHYPLSPGNQVQYKKSKLGIHQRRPQNNEGNEHVVLVRMDKAYVN